MFILQLMVACFVTWLLIQKWRRRHFEELYQKLKTSASRLPFLGHIYLFFQNEEEIMKKIQLYGREAIRSGGITSFWGVYKLYMHVADSEVADIILKNCLEKDDVVKSFHIVLGDGSLFASVEKWRPRRKYLAPTFGMKNLNQYVETFSELSCLLVDKIRKEIKDGQDTIPMAKTYLLYSFNAIFGSLDLPVKVMKNADHPFLIALEEVLSALITRAYQPWLYNDFVYKMLPRYRIIARHKAKVFGLIHEIIEGKRKQTEKYSEDSKKDVLTRNNPKSFINLMIESTDVSDDTIREESIIMISAATDTTAVSLGYSTLMLARHPEVQEKVYQELKEVIGEFDRPIMPEDLPHFKYLDAFIRETLRLYPPIPLIVRKVVKNTELPSGVTLLPGCGVFINIWAINRNPTHWGEDAEEFKPERFLDPAPRHPAAFVTFSHGPRNCLGYQYAMMSMKTVIATLLNQYRIMPASDDLKNEPLRVKYDLLMRHIDNYRVRFEPRK